MDGTLIKVDGSLTQSTKFDEIFSPSCSGFKFSKVRFVRPYSTNKQTNKEQNNFFSGPVKTREEKLETNIPWPTLLSKTKASESHRADGSHTFSYYLTSQKATHTIHPTSSFLSLWRVRASNKSLAFIIRVFMALVRCY